MGRKTTMLIVGGVVVGVAVLAGVLLSLGGGSGSKSPSVNTSRSASTGRHASHGSSAAVAAPGETHVVVLNATEANGLAHHLAEHLRQGGYTLAAALDGHPPSGRSSSVVEYTNSHHSEAQRVGQALGIAETAPLEGAIAQLVGSATVVVIAGADQAAQVGGGSGEAATGTGTGSGEAAAGTGNGEATGAGSSGEASAGTGAGGEASATP
jgi:hypothetical protein